MTAHASWQVGPVQLWLRPHRHGERGEPQARQLLGPALGIDSARVPLERDARGRPSLQPALSDWDTGWSHSGDYLLVGLGRGVRLGVDLERIRARPRLLDIAQRFFHPDELALLAALGADAQQALFFRLWCAKEALLKAYGHGLSFGLHRLAYTLAPDGALQLQWCDPELGDAAQWQLHEWWAAPDCRAALAFYPQPAA
ncbi:4'-phosphopantetheinyl transferase family protein [Xanthomonas vesicatoria]|uniref:4'-phosphopantetheinyl transferase family protein n=1 Tax=Xanthomonas vesicatoria TaxID=56460 RepID=UPI0009BCF05E|nr:4'-phosphopantetheinyl transferase superfamily protein [Xanthomonas vesicatoria]MCC8557782.1 4'-phosphopantetheinyl transferase superfamily protein [Xanthomonas vesicatoria]MCC8600785.1 4'-phosphopantetheinyl transferase superfamily protein [Xanthomonas vesicatoria]MCC8607830.1 4'-phosphopantetheinyl transferase superfamily protein [Xanthomonas vesicatoria]MCC8675809.1 4'-phosphopantetheinyl transferase superfamily protein [Xanthomonas vesicatoria]MCC8677830.1 4'-phosphopantetheinyl transfe